MSTSAPPIPHLLLVVRGDQGKRKAGARHRPSNCSKQEIPVSHRSPLVYPSTGRQSGRLRSAFSFLGTTSAPGWASTAGADYRASVTRYNQHREACFWRPVDRTHSGAITTRELRSRRFLRPLGNPAPCRRSNPAYLGQCSQKHALAPLEHLSAFLWGGAGWSPMWPSGPKSSGRPTKGHRPPAHMSICLPTVRHPAGGQSHGHQVPGAGGAQRLLSGLQELPLPSFRTAYRPPAVIGGKTWPGSRMPAASRPPQATP